MSLEQNKVPVRFGREKSRRRYVPAGGSWESLLTGLRDALPEELHVVGEADHFIEQDKKVEMSLGEAVFQYYLAGKGHLTMSEMVIDSFPQIKAGAASNDLRKKMIRDLADFLYDHYPNRYKSAISK